MVNKRTVLVFLVFGLVASFLFLRLTPQSVEATNCPSGDTFVSSAIAPNGNSLVVCQSSYAGGSLDWYIYNSAKTQLNSSGYTGATLQGLYATPDSKFLFIYSVGGSLGWYIYGANGQHLSGTGFSGATLQGVAITNDGKIAVVIHYAGGSVSWYIYGSNGAQTDSSGDTGYIRRIQATSDNKIVIEDCYTPTNSVYTYTYGVSGTLESRVNKGPCSGGGVGGIFELPEIAANSEALSTPVPNNQQTEISDETNLSWLIPVLAALGLAGIVGYSVLRLYIYTRR